MSERNGSAPAVKSEGVSSTHTAANRSIYESIAVRTYPDKIVLSVEAQEYLENLPVDLHNGIVELHQLPTSLFALYSLGWDRGCVAGYDNREEALGARIRRLKYERDLFHFCYVNRKTPADFMRAQTDALWAEAVSS